jgi:hypothetical protein
MLTAIQLTPTSLANLKITVFWDILSQVWQKLTNVLEVLTAPHAFIS